MTARRDHHELTNECLSGTLVLPARHRARPVGGLLVVTISAARQLAPVDAVRHADGVAVNALVARAGIFQMVDPDAVAMLTKQLQSVQFSSRQCVFAQGEPGERLYIIASGKIKIGRRAADGRSHLLAVLGSSDMFGELSVFDPGPRTSSATALTEVHALAMDRDVLQRWIGDRPEIAPRLLRVLARRLRRTDNDLCDLIFTDVAGRVARQLLRLAQRFGVQDGGVMRVNHDLTQDELAQLVGATRETVNKVLTEFTQRGWITLDGKSVLIIESERLLRRAR